MRKLQFDKKMDKRLQSILKINQKITIRKRVKIRKISKKNKNNKKEKEKTTNRRKIQQIILNKVVLRMQVKTITQMMSMNLMKQSSCVNVRIKI